MNRRFHRAHDRATGKQRITCTRCGWSKAKDNQIDIQREAQAHRCPAELAAAATKKEAEKKARHRKTMPSAAARLELRGGYLGEQEWRDALKLAHEVYRQRQKQMRLDRLKRLTALP